MRSLILLSLKSTQKMQRNLVLQTEKWYLLLPEEEKFRQKLVYPKRQIRVNAGCHSIIWVVPTGSPVMLWTLFPVLRNIKSVL